MKVHDEVRRRAASEERPPGSDEASRNGSRPPAPSPSTADRGGPGGRRGGFALPDLDELEQRVLERWNDDGDSRSLPGRRPRPGTFLRTLARLRKEPSSQIVRSLLRAEVWKLLVELRRGGADRVQAQREFITLTYLTRVLLEEAGASPDEARGFVDPALPELEIVLDWPAR